MRNERGIAMAICLFVLAMLSGVTAAALSMSRADVLTSKNYRSASQGLEAAEAGIEHAVAIISNPGVINLLNDIINVYSGGTVPFASTPNPMALNTSFSYRVNVYSYNHATNGLAGLP